MRIDVHQAEALPGVLEVMTHENAPRLQSDEDPEQLILQSEAVAYHGQFVGVVVAETLETARAAASQVDVEYAELVHDVVLRADRHDLYKPDKVNPAHEADTDVGDVESALASAAVCIDCTYTTPHYHNNPLEPHTTVASWSNDGLVVYDANQGSHTIQADLAKLFGLEVARVRVISPYVGGAFGSKAFTHQHVVAAVMAARVVGRPVKLALTRQQMFDVVGYRTPTIQRIRMGADGDGRLMAITHDVVEQTSTVKEFAEQTAVTTRMLYAAHNRRTSHRLAQLDLPVPTIMRPPGESPFMFALESAMDEIALACGLDPIDFRVRNEPTVDPETGHPFSSRGLVACLQEGARRFGWRERDSRPRTRPEGRWLVGTGVAASTYPTRLRASTAAIRVDRTGRYCVMLDASDIGTGAWTVLTQIAADALEVPTASVQVQIGDSDLPKAPGAGGSMGTASWGSAIVDAARKLRARLRDECDGVIPDQGLECTGEVTDNPEAQRFAMHAFGAQFAEARVDMDTGEVRIPRLLGIFGVGRVINPKTARSQLLGGMTMGLSMRCTRRVCLIHGSAIRPTTILPST